MAIQVLARIPEENGQELVGAGGVLMVVVGDRGCACGRPAARVINATKSGKEFHVVCDRCYEACVTAEVAYYRRDADKALAALAELAKFW